MSYDYGNIEDDYSTGAIVIKLLSSVNYSHPFFLFSLFFYLMFGTILIYYRKHKWVSSFVFAFLVLCLFSTPYLINFIRGIVNSQEFDENGLFIWTFWAFPIMFILALFFLFLIYDIFKIYQSRKIHNIIPQNLSPNQQTPNTAQKETKPQ